MKSIKTLIISGAVTLVMALPLSGMAAGHKHGKQLSGDQQVAKLCIMQNVLNNVPAQRIVRAYCAQDDGVNCAGTVTGIINERLGSDLTPQMLAVAKAKEARNACIRVAKACKTNNCLKGYWTPSS